MANIKYKDSKGIWQDLVIVPEMVVESEVKPNSINPVSSSAVKTYVDTQIGQIGGGGVPGGSGDCTCIAPLEIILDYSENGDGLNDAQKSINAETFRITYEAYENNKFDISFFAKLTDAIPMIWRSSAYYVISNTTLMVMFDAIPLRYVIGSEYETKLYQSTAMPLCKLIVVISDAGDCLVAENLSVDSIGISLLEEDTFTALFNKISQLGYVGGIGGVYRTEVVIQPIGIEFKKPFINNSNIRLNNGYTTYLMCSPNVIEMTIVDGDGVRWKLYSNDAYDEIFIVCDKNAKITIGSDNTKIYQENKSIFPIYRNSYSVISPDVDTSLKIYDEATQQYYTPLSINYVTDSSFSDYTHYTVTIYRNNSFENWFIYKDGHVVKDTVTVINETE